MTEKIISRIYAYYFARINVYPKLHKVAVEYYVVLHGGIVYEYTTRIILSVCRRHASIAVSGEVFKTGVPELCRAVFIGTLRFAAR